MRAILLTLFLVLSVTNGDQQINRQYYNNNNPYYPFYHSEDWVRCNLGLRPTVVETSTWTVMVTCTVKNASPCRKLQEDKEAIILPTAVTNRIIPTAESKLESQRKERRRQIPFVTDSRLYEIRSTLMDGPYLLPYPPKSPYMPIPVAVDDRFFFGPVTRTSTTFTVSTFTSRPSCSQASGVAQCP